ncbi:MAG: class I SAM-dependent methyltransferase [Planctomycetota bacterium]
MHAFDRLPNFAMHLATGIPTLDGLAELQRSPLYQAHTASNQAFLDKHGPALKDYGDYWGQHPFKMWSRRWEYPFAGSRVMEYSAAIGRTDLKMLDAGSGVTYLPYMLVDELAGAEVLAVDSDRSYIPMFAAINEARGDKEGNERVSFTPALLQDLPLEAESLDVVMCVSVLEHTDRYDTILTEFKRVLKPGGALVLTFDLSLDGKFNLKRADAEALLGFVTEQFEAETDVTPLLDQWGVDGTMTTDHVDKTEPELLPWKYPRIVHAVHDLAKGRGWTGGFRSKSVFCLAARKPGV